MWPGINLVNVNTAVGAWMRKSPQFTRSSSNITGGVTKTGVTIVSNRFALKYWFSMRRRLETICKSQPHHKKNYKRTKKKDWFMFFSEILFCFPACQLHIEWLTLTSSTWGGDQQLSWRRCAHLGFQTDILKRSLTQDILFLFSRSSITSASPSTSTLLTKARGSTISSTSTLMSVSSIMTGFNFQWRDALEEEFWSLVPQSDHLSLWLLSIVFPHSPKLVFCY